MLHFEKCVHKRRCNAYAVRDSTGDLIVTTLCNVSLFNKTYYVEHTSPDVLAAFCKTQVIRCLQIYKREISPRCTYPLHSDGDTLLRTYVVSYHVLVICG